MNIIDIIGLSKTYGPRTLLDGVGFSLDEHEKAAVIGANGSGKSTLFSILAGLEQPDGGTIMKKRGARIGYLSQEPRLDDSLTVAQEIERGLVEIRRALAEYEEIAHALSRSDGDTARLLERQGELSGWIEHHGGWSTDYLVREMMTHLDLPDPHQRIGTLSGGNRRRVALARLLLEAPDLLLLDEPTNHLDADTTQWLQEYLTRFEGAVLLVTHDRYFLDRVATRILELDRGTVTSYAASYSGYVTLKEERLVHEERTQSRLLNLLRGETAWMRRGPKARSTKQKARIDRYHDLVERTAVQRRDDLKLDFASDEGLGGTVLEFRNIDKTLGDRKLVSGLTLGMKRSDRIGIIGRNGTGKTTLLRMIMGELQPDAGEVVIGRKTKIAYFDQRRDLGDPNRTLYEYLGEGDYVHMPGGEKRHKIGYLEDFLFQPSDRMRRVGSLSGGEKSRLILAKLMLENANLLILDEPTNDLDIPTMQLLDDALERFPGCVLVVTHDRFFLDKVATGILAFEGEGRQVYYEGNYSLYRELKEQSEKPLAQPAVQERKKEPEQPKKKKGLSYNEKLELERLEEAIAGAEERQRALEAVLGDPAGHPDYPGGIAAASTEYATVEQELARMYERWEELEMKR